MMKKYNKPEIVTLALDKVDVIETSVGAQLAQDELAKAGYAAATIEQNIDQMRDTWSW